MKVLSVVGARPQFVKLSPIARALRQSSHEHIIVHTGQHYAPELSDSLFTDLEIPEPDLNLEIGSASHARQTAGMLVGLEDAFNEYSPDWVLVYGDTNSTLAASLAAIKMHLPLAHLEAGLRSGNRQMPEEHNRIVTDHLADLLLAPTQTAMRHLAHEGLAKRARNVGDVMVDVCFRVRDAVTANPPQMPEGWSDTGSVILATIHRAENTDDPVRLEYILAKMNELGERILLVAHPRLVAKADEFGLPLRRGLVETIGSMTYSQMNYGVGQAVGVMTDSGGLQKEAFLLQTPCLTVRAETEWPETLTGGWNILDPLLGTDVLAHFKEPKDASDSTPFGAGSSAHSVVAELENNL